MKKTLLFILPLFMLYACEKENISDTNKNDNEKPIEVNKPPLIKSINLEKTTFGKKQILLATATIEDPENDKVESVWTYENKEYSEENSVFKIKLETLGEKTIIVTAKDAKGNTSTLSKEIKVIENDFGFAIWNDEIEVIERSETGKFNGWTGKATGETGRYKEFKGSGEWRGYTFKDKKLVGGYVTEKFTSKFLNEAQYEAIIIFYESILNKLIDKNGDYTSQQSSVNWDYGRANAGLSILLNGRRIITTFTSKRSEIRYIVETNEPNVVSYIVEYTKK